MIELDQIRRDLYRLHLDFLLCVYADSYVRTNEPFELARFYLVRIRSSLSDYLCFSVFCLMISRLLIVARLWLLV